MNSCHSWNTALFFFKVPFQIDFKDLLKEQQHWNWNAMKCLNINRDHMMNYLTALYLNCINLQVHSGHFNRELQELLASSRRRVVGQRSDRAVWHSCPLLDMKMAVVQTEQHVTWVWKKIKHRCTSTLVFIQYLHNFQPFQIIKREREEKSVVWVPVLVTNKHLLSLWMRSAWVALISKIPVQLLITFPRLADDEVRGWNF